MAETREVFDPFDSKTVSIRNDLVLRLRGKYASGPTLPNGEPEFGWREFPTPPIQHEAADEIERLTTQLNSIPTPQAMLLQARKPGGEWIGIFPAQLSWMAKAGIEVRALDGSTTENDHAEDNRT